MTKSDLINRIMEYGIREEINSLSTKMVVKQGVQVLIDNLASSLAEGRRIEIRGFGSFYLSKRPARVGRNPKTGERVEVPARNMPHFKTGKELNDRINKSFKNL